MAMAAFAREVQLVLVGVIAGEGHPLGYQPFDRPAAALGLEDLRRIYDELAMGPGTAS